MKEDWRREENFAVCALIGNRREAEKEERSGVVEDVRATRERRMCVCVCVCV